MIWQSEQSAWTLASNSGLSCASYLVVLLSGSSRAIFLAPPDELPPPEFLVVEQAAPTSVIMATTPASRNARPMDLPGNLATSLLGKGSRPGACSAPRRDDALGACGVTSLR